MEKNIAISASQNTRINNISNLTNFVMNIIAIISKAVAPLSKYYSICLEREISIKQTWILLNVQVAFFAAIFSSTTFSSITILCYIWLYYAFMSCKKNL